MTKPGNSNENIYDVAIIGGGPAGLTAAIYLGRARYRVLVIEKERFGGQMATTTEIANYPGIANVSGEQLARTMFDQAASFGAELLVAKATALDMNEPVKTVHTDKGDIHCLAVLLATGAAPRRIGFGGEDDFVGRGVSYCATCDGALFAGKEVLVIGGGYQAAEESIFLAKYAKKVTVIMRKGDFNCAKSLAEAAWKHPKIEVFPSTRVTRITGDTAIRAAVLEDTITKGRETWRPENPDESFGVFVLAGRKPATTLIKGLAECDEDGSLLVNERSETSCPGLFAAGDVCKKELRQVATAVGQAAACATQLERFLEDARKTTGITPEQPPKNERATSVAASVRQIAADSDDAENSLLTAEMREILARAAQQMKAKLVLKVSLDERPVSKRLRELMNELDACFDPIAVEMEESPSAQTLPRIDICREDGAWTGLAFHGAPLGHEFDPFVESLISAANKSDSLNEADKQRILSIEGPMRLQVAAGLDCLRCRNTIIPVEQVASLNGNVTAEIYDIAHFPALQERYNIMSVPYLIVNDGEIVRPGGTVNSMSDLLALIS